VAQKGMSVHIVASMKHSPAVPNGITGERLRVTVFNRLNGLRSETICRTRRRAKVMKAVFMALA
jgi:hypothetical protein